MSRKRKSKDDGVLKQYRHEIGRIGGGYGAIYPASVLGQPEDSFGAGVVVPDDPGELAPSSVPHTSSDPSDGCRARISTTVDRDLLARARQEHQGATDAELIDCALAALVARHRQAQFIEEHAAASPSI